MINKLKHLNVYFQVVLTVFSCKIKRDENSKGGEMRRKISSPISRNDP